MSKKFNDTGTCNPEKHYMVNMSRKLDQITIDFILKGDYFVINRPRQYGKTTTLFLLSKLLNDRDDFISLKISFEAFSESIWSMEKYFVRELLYDLANEFSFLKMGQIAEDIEVQATSIDNMAGLSRYLTKIIKKIKELFGCKIVLMIDEVDKAANNQLFMDFLGMLRNKYLQRNEGRDNTFHSVILAGVYDVKKVKQQVKSKSDKKYNSPWNIAVDFTIDLSFNSEDIRTMLNVYLLEKKVKMDINLISEKLYYYTSGYPFLVSKLCKIIDEELMGDNNQFEWSECVVENAVNIILKKTNTNFGSLIKNLENNRDLYEFVFDIVIFGTDKGYNEDNPTIESGKTYGLFKNENGMLKIHNRIYEQRIYNYMSSVLDPSTSMDSFNVSDKFITNEGLDLEFVLLRFQKFMKEQYSSKDDSFLERNGRLLFLAFLRPIINGKGYDFKEVETSEEKRLDVVITMLNKRYIVELKIWRGVEAHKKGLDQLTNYLDIFEQDNGFLLIFDKTRKGEKVWREERIKHMGKDIFVVWV